MKRNIFIAVFSLVVISMACSSQNTNGAPNSEAKTTSVPPNELLAGKKFKITTYTGGKTEGPDFLSFTDKTVESSECGKYGFTPSSYTCTRNNNFSISFTTTMTSPKEGRMDWKGTVTDKHIEGSFLWVKAGQADIAYTFNGDLQ